MSIFELSYDSQSEVLVYNIDEIIIRRTVLEIPLLSGLADNLDNHAFYGVQQL